MEPKFHPNHRKRPRIGLFFLDISVSYLTLPNMTQDKYIYIAVYIVLLKTDGIIFFRDFILHATFVPSRKRHSEPNRRSNVDENNSSFSVPHVLLLVHVLR
jgi:hypothetical protein